MKLISWNVNGLRAVVGKNFYEVFRDLDADIFCLQETKLQGGQLDLLTEGYHQYWNYAEKKGYSGTAVFTKKEPLSVSCGIGIEEHDHEAWEDAFRGYLVRLAEKKPVVMCGDLNVAHEEIDLKNPKTNHQNAGFTDEERGKMTELLASGFIDTFRYFYPDQKDIYSWWSYRFHAREKNVGWRIDYFIASDSMKERLVDAKIHTEIEGSDHCPVELVITEQEK